MANPAVLTVWLFVLSAVCGGTAAQAQGDPVASIVGLLHLALQLTEQIQKCNVTALLLEQGSVAELEQVDGGWSDWTDHNGCSVTCGTGTQTQVRICNNPAPANGGMECVLLDGTKGLTETQNLPCVLGSCPAVTASGFRNATFTTLGYRGRLGPASLTYHYITQDHENLVTLENGIQYFTVPDTAYYRIQAAGAAGGWDFDSNRADRGKGALVMGTFLLQAGELLKILVGQEGVTNTGRYYYAGGGGGGTFVTKSDDLALIIAGGGGGGRALQGHHAECDGTARTTGQAGYAPYETFPGGAHGHGATSGSGEVGGGGGGLLTNGGSSEYFGGTDNTEGGEGGYAFVNGGLGGRGRYHDIDGGFGGGGGAEGEYDGGAGGGGGYSGGGRGDSFDDACGGGGGSYNAGSNPDGLDGNNDGPGYVVITKM